jgi:hypothetical protein
MATVGVNVDLDRWVASRVKHLPPDDQLDDWG